MKDKTPANFLTVLKGRTIVNFLVGGLAAWLGLAVSCLGGGPRFWWCHVDPTRPSGTLYTP
jgi:hypothetical protein